MEKKRTALQASERDFSSQGGLDPKLEVAVPANQRPVNELAQLRDGQLYSWATLEGSQYARRLVTVWLGMFALVSGPIAYQTFDPSQQPIEWAVAGCLGSLVVVVLVVLRIYLGWAYVGDRLLSAAVPYEETGWYDGQTFQKPPEVLARDRLLGSYEVKPKLALLKRTLLGTGGALAVCSVLLVGLIRTGADADGIVGRGASRIPRQITGEGVVFSSKVQHLQDLLDDDVLAAEEAKSQGGVPGYCADRYFRASAGGQYCTKFDGGRAK